MSIKAWSRSIKLAVRENYLYTIMTFPIRFIGRQYPAGASEGKQWRMKERELTKKIFTRIHITLQHRLTSAQC